MLEIVPIYVNFSQCLDSCFKSEFNILDRIGILRKLLRYMIEYLSLLNSRSGLRFDNPGPITCEYPLVSIIEVPKMTEKNIHSKDKNVIDPNFVHNLTRA